LPIAENLSNAIRGNIDEKWIYYQFELFLTYLDAKIRIDLLKEFIKKINVYRAAERSKIIKMYHHQAIERDHDLDWGMFNIFFNWVSNDKEEMEAHFNNLASNWTK
jgi:hypothetical protein